MDTSVVCRSPLESTLILEKRITITTLSQPYKASELYGGETACQARINQKQDDHSHQQPRKSAQPRTEKKPHVCVEELNAEFIHQICQNAWAETVNDCLAAAASGLKSSDPLMDKVNREKKKKAKKKKKAVAKKSLPKILSFLRSPSPFLSLSLSLSFSLSLSLSLLLSPFLLRIRLIMFSEAHYVLLDCPFISSTPFSILQHWRKRKLSLPIIAPSCR